MSTSLPPILHKKRRTQTSPLGRLSAAPSEFALSGQEEETRKLHSSGLPLPAMGKRRLVEIGLSQFPSRFPHEFLIRLRCRGRGHMHDSVIAIGRDTRHMACQVRWA
jgi:hypothetical protein